MILHFRSLNKIEIHLVACVIVLMIYTYNTGLYNPLLISKSQTTLVFSATGGMIESQSCEDESLLPQIWRKRLQE